MGNRLLREEQAEDASIGSPSAQRDPAAGGRGPGLGESPVPTCRSHRPPDLSPAGGPGNDPADGPGAGVREVPNPRAGGDSGPEELSSPAQLLGDHLGRLATTDGGLEQQPSEEAPREGGGGWDSRQDLEDVLKELRAAQEDLPGLASGQAHQGQLEARTSKEPVDHQGPEISPTLQPTLLRAGLRGQPRGEPQGVHPAVLRKWEPKLQAAQLKLAHGLTTLDCGNGQGQGWRGDAQEQNGAGSSGAEGPPPSSSSSSSSKTRSGRTGSESRPRRPQADIVAQETVPQGEVPAIAEEEGDKLSILATGWPLSEGQSVPPDTQEQREGRTPGKAGEAASEPGSHVLVYWRHLEEGDTGAEGSKGRAALLEEEERRQQAARATGDQETISHLQDLVAQLMSEREELEKEVKRLKEKMKVEAEDWLQFQRDLHLAVTVADRLRLEAEAETEDLRERLREEEEKNGGLGTRLEGLKSCRNGADLSDGLREWDLPDPSPSIPPRVPAANGTKHSSSEGARRWRESKPSPETRAVSCGDFKATEGLSGKEGSSADLESKEPDRYSLKLSQLRAPGKPRFIPVAEREDVRSSEKTGETLAELVKRSGGSRRNTLLKWCKMKTEGYQNIDITNFSSSWSDGLAFCALLHTYLPGHIPYGELQAQHKKRNLTLAFKTAESVGIKSTMVAEEVMRADAHWQDVLQFVESIYNHFES